MHTMCLFGVLKGQFTIKYEGKLEGYDIGKEVGNKYPMVLRAGVHNSVIEQYPLSRCCGVIVTGVDHGCRNQRFIVRGEEPFV